MKPCKIVSVASILILSYDIRSSSNFDSYSPHNEYGDDLPYFRNALPPCVFAVSSLWFGLYRYTTNYVIRISLSSPRIPVNVNKTTVFIMHGFTSGSNFSDYKELADNWIKLNVSNVIAVDWKRGACDGGISLSQFFSRPLPITNTTKVARYIANIIGRLVNDFHVNLDNITLVGHSIGAQLAAFTAKAVQDMNLGTIRRLIALNPPGPGFENNRPEHKILRSDASFVQIFHTIWGTGSDKPFGDNDYYFDGGLLQKECSVIDMNCSYDLSVRYLTETIKNPECKFIGRPWNRTSLTVPLEPCTKQNCSVAGPRALEYPARGVFFVSTNRVKPYCTELEFNALEGNHTTPKPGS